jgi:hypothetical protein
LVEGSGARQAKPSRSLLGKSRWLLLLLLLLLPLLLVAVLARRCVGTFLVWRLLLRLAVLLAVLYSPGAPMIDQLSIT